MNILPAVAQTFEFDWTVQGSSTGNDRTLGMATDQSDNVIITGGFENTYTIGDTSFTSGGGKDCFIAKYDNQGELLWAKHGSAAAPGGSEAGNTEGHAAAVDLDDNIICIGAYVHSMTIDGITLANGSLDQEGFVIKMDPDGSILWTKRIIGYRFINAYGVAVDNSGSVYIVGQFGHHNLDGTIQIESTQLTPYGGNDVFLAKLDSNGNLRWLKQAGSNISINGNDFGYSISCDSDANVYITGTFVGTGVFGSHSVTSLGDRDVFVAKYDSTGTSVWAVNAGGASWDEGRAIVCDPAGNSYVTGRYNGTATFGTYTLNSHGEIDYFLMKLNSSGAILWVRDGGGTGSDTGWAIDYEQDRQLIHTIGYFEGTAYFESDNLISSGEQDILFVTYDSSGALQNLQNAGSSLDDAGFAVAAGANECFYTSGYFNDTIVLGSENLTSAGNTDVYLSRILLTDPNIVCGHISVDTIWDSDTIKVNCDVTIDDGVTLTIEPGTVVEFQGHYKLNVLGRLLAQGIESDSIIFMPVNRSTGWFGVRFPSTDAANDSSIFSYCHFEYGKANGNAEEDKRGGAVSVRYFSKVRISHSTFQNNYASKYGGAINCEFGDIVMHHLDIQYNESDGWGGGISCTWSDVCLSNSILRYNECVWAGGGFNHDNSHTVIENVEITNNHAHENGGGLHGMQASQTLRNVLIANNQADHDGGGLSHDNLSNPQYINVTVVNNTALWNGGGIFCYEASHPTLTNCIVWGNSPNQVEFLGSLGSNGITISYSDFQGAQSGVVTNGNGSVSWGTGNISSTPQFSGSGLYPFSLSDSSPCKDTGKSDTTGYSLPSTDLAGNSRIINDRIDMGGYENQTVINITINVPAEYGTIQAAINAASSGDTILVQPGTYSENINFTGKDVVVASLVLTTGDTSYTSQTIIDGGGSGPVVTFENGETSNAQLIGFTLQNGRGKTENSLQHGGGIYCINSSPKLSYLTIRNNVASGQWSNEGAGIFFNYSGSELTHSLISNNYCTGGTYCNGGGILCNRSPITLQNVVICNNSTFGQYGYGGAMTISGDTTAPLLDHVTLANNHAGSSSGKGGALYLHAETYVEVKNSILYGNTSTDNNQVTMAVATIAITYSDVQGAYTGTGNINSDPLFASPSGGSGHGYNGIIADWHLQSSSPCIDIGDPASPLDSDGTVTDMGANALIHHEESVNVDLPDNYEFNEDGDGHTVVMNITDLTGSGAMSVNQVNNPPSNAPGASVVQLYWDLSSVPEITSFSVNITFHYNDSDLEGITESGAFLGLAKFSESTNSWTWLGGTIDPDNNTITVSGITGFSTFALFRNIFGDVNGDGYVDAADLQRLGDCWHATGGEEFGSGTDGRFMNYNKNENGGNQIIDAADLQVFGDCWHNGQEP